MAKYALVIANNQYSDPGLAQLSAPGQDAEDLARVLRSKEIGAFEEVKVLLNQPEPVVREAIDGFFTLKKSDDLLLLYFSGHGVRDEQGALYLAVTNTNRDRLRSTGIKSDFIRESMDQSRSRRQVLILDCCNSGAYAQGSKAAVGVTIGTRTAFEGTGYGRVILTATDATQFAWEGDKVIGKKETSNSLFTHFLVKGLEGEADQDGDGKITVDELYDYAYEQIVSRTPAQTPGKWSYKQQGEIILRQTAVEEIKPAALPSDLVTALESSYPSFREAAVRQLEELLRGKNAGLAISARAALERLASTDDSRRVADLASQALEPYRRNEREGADKAARYGSGSAQVPDTGSLSSDVTSTGEVGAGLDTSSMEIARPIKAEMETQPGESDRFTLDERADRDSIPNARVETTQLNNRSHHVPAFWIALVWTIFLSISVIVAQSVNNDIGSGYLTGDWIGALLGGTLGGLGTAVVLRQNGAFKGWKNLPIVSIGFVLGVAVIFNVGNSIGYEGGDSQAFVIGYGLSGVIGGAIAGLGVGLYMLMEHAVSGWKSVAWICASYALGFGVGGAALAVLFGLLESGTSSLVNAAVRGALSGAIAGWIAGAGCNFWLKKQAQ
jgi:uncharacterized caspase-like protein